MRDVATCEHYSVVVDGNITCKHCGSVYRIDWTGPAHWVDRSKPESVYDGLSNEQIRGLHEQRWVPASVVDCRKGSCQRHGQCMYLNFRGCPFGGDHP